MAIAPPQQLVAAVVTQVAVVHPGVVAGGDAADAPLLLGPLEHRAEFHLPVAAGAGQGRDASRVALHQKIDDLGLEVLPKIDHMVGDGELFADPRRIHQTLGAAGTLATHQPEGEPLHLPTRFHQQGCRQGAVHTAGKTHRHPLFTRPGPQPLQGGTTRRGAGQSGAPRVGNGDRQQGRQPAVVLPS